MATVYEAVLPSQGPRVALKVAHEGQSDAVKEEADYLANLRRVLDHPNILKILPLPFSDNEREYYAARDLATNRWYLALEYADGGSLRDKLNREGIIPLEEAVKIISQVGEALEYAHSQGIIHRDCKPSNILFKRLPSGEYRVLLADFGIAGNRLVAGRAASAGTRGYMSPEQVKGEVADHRSDIYALGVILYEMLTGRLPSTNIASRLSSPRLPREVEAVIRKALEPDPSRRFQSVREMLMALREATLVRAESMTL